MTIHKGHYSLVQYCPDPARMEAVNVGVLLFCPEIEFLSVMVSRDNRRVQQFFGREGHDWQQLNMFKQGIQERITRESARPRSLEDLQRFIDSRANLFRFSEPIPMRVTDPATELARLFDVLVGGEMEQKHPPKQRFLTVVSQRLKTANLGKKLRENVPVEVPFLKKPVQFPFGFQNGRFNLIQPVSFVAEDPDDAVRKAWSFAAEGESLYDHPHKKFGDLKLVIVGQFRSANDEARGPISKLLERCHVRLIPDNQLNALVQEIMSTGKIIEV